MKKITFIALLVVTVPVVYCQITTTKITPKTNQDITIPYDSTENFMGMDAYKYQGQELYLKGKPENHRKYGYENFVIDYKQEKSANNANIYKCCDGYNSKYSELAGKYFIVLEILKHPKAEQNEYYYGRKFYLKLQEKESKDIVYYEYDSKYENSFPFIVVGFFEKQKGLFVGKEFIFNDSEFDGATDIQTGKAITTRTGQKWKCMDITIDDKYYNLSLIFENSLGEKVSDEYDRILNVAYPVKKADNYKKKFGVENFNKILQGKITIGMTKEMCKLSIGEPIDINQTITSGKKKEQWVYSDKYLYFDNAILTTIQLQKTE